MRVRGPAPGTESSASRGAKLEPANKVPDANPVGPQLRAFSRSLRSRLMSALLIGPTAGALLASTAGAATASSPTVLVSRLHNELLTADHAVAQKRVLPAQGYEQIAALATTIRSALPHASKLCQVALAAAARLPGERGSEARLGIDVITAFVGLPQCTAAPIPSGSPDVGGTVVNSNGKRLANLRVDITAVTSPRGAIYGSVQLSVVTDGSGHFSIARSPDTIGALAWQAEAAFPWHGGTWDRYLTTVSDRDPRHLTFRSDLTSGPAGYARSTTDGSIVRLYDPNGCGAFGYPGNTAYPATDPNTSSIVVTLTPDGPMLDGSTAHSYTVSVPKSTLCLETDSIKDIPAGAWYLTATSDAGRRISFSFPTDSVIAPSAIVFDQPQGQNTSPVQEVDIHFADQTGA